VYLKLKKRFFSTNNSKDIKKNYLKYFISYNKNIEEELEFIKPNKFLHDEI